jgi:hypothetical protein
MSGLYFSFCSFAGQYFLMALQIPEKTVKSYWSKTAIYSSLARMRMICAAISLTVVGFLNISKQIA